VTAAAGNVQTGADPAGAESALKRLKEEAENLSQQREAMLKQSAERKKLGFVIGAALLVLGFLVVRFGGGFVVGLSLMMAGILTLKFIRGADKRASTDMRELQAKIDVVNGRIEDHPYRSLAPTLPSRDGTN